LRLLLDEMYPAAVAEQLRARGHDVSAVTERPELRSLPDPELFAIAGDERRAVVTENVADFAVVVADADLRGVAHFGVVFVDPMKYPRGRRSTIGRLVKQLDVLLADHPGDRRSSPHHWL